MTKIERKWHDAIIEIGCIVCGAAAIMHHITRGGRRIGHLFSIPLCPYHHKDSGHGIHDGKKRFEALHGTEMELLEEAKRRVGWAQTG